MNEDDETTATHQSKEFLKNLGKRNQCYLQLSHDSTTDPTSGYNTTKIVDDVGAPLANVRSYRIEQKSGEPPVLILEIVGISLMVTTR